ncbi:MAG: PepSY domain-containing protein [Ardenticatenaceae bacterium]|nr:PepSY domain-containing protein [Ardenticatenaceae bacterium]MCB8989844.1 PepSY domain-containing protein [Ardenticatenaceae bacterium]
MKINKRIATTVMLAGLLVGSLGVGLTLTGKPGAAAAAPVQQTQAVDGDTAQEPFYTGSIPMDEAQTDGMSEADESAALQGQAIVSADEAKAAAEAANPGANTVKVELDNENGMLVYSVALDNGLDVKIDAGNAAILHTEQAGDDAAEEDNEANEANEADEASDTDDVQEEHEAENEADDATEGPEVPEDAPEAVPAP